jgi:hypothetical protein
MKKQNIYQKARASKLVVTSFWIFFGFLFFGDFVVANTVISNAGNSTFSSNIVMDYGTDHYIHFNGTCIVAVGTGQTGACL